VALGLPIFGSNASFPFFVLVLMNRWSYVMHAFLLWNPMSLAVMDPYVILPNLDGPKYDGQHNVLNPTPPDPMPSSNHEDYAYRFTFFLCMVPAGLVLYWVTQQQLVYHSSSYNHYQTYRRRSVTYFRVICSSIKKRLPMRPFFTFRLPWFPC